VLRDSLLGTPFVLDNYSWRLQLSMVDDQNGKKKQPTAILDWKLLDVKEKEKIEKEKRKRNTVTSNENTQTDPTKKDNQVLNLNSAESHMTMELAITDIQKLYDAFETIQKQLDALTDK